MDKTNLTVSDLEILSLVCSGGNFDIGPDGEPVAFVAGQWLSPSEAENLLNETVHVLSVEELGKGVVNGEFTHGIEAQLIVRVKDAWVTDSVILTRNLGGDRWVAWHSPEAWMGQDLFHATCGQDDLPKLQTEIEAAVTAAHRANL